MGQHVGNYTPAARQAAIALARTVGAAEAGRQLGIPCGTLSCWLFKARKGQEGFAGAAEVPAGSPGAGNLRPPAPAPSAAGQPSVTPSDPPPTPVSPPVERREQATTPTPARSRAARL